METSLGRQFTNFTNGKLLQYGSEIVRCLERLDDRQVWERAGSNENAIGNLVLHLCGNVRQRIAAIESQPDMRVRAAEFAAAGGLSARELILHLRSAVDEAQAVIGRLTDERPRERVLVGEFDQTILEAVYHMSSHFALHTGQIIFATKRLTGEDLGFYKPPVHSATKRD